MIIIGIDPAKDGAAVLLQDNNVIGVWSWKFLKRKQSIYKTIYTYIENDSIYKEQVEFPSGGMIAHFIADSLEFAGLGSFRVGIEDAYVSKINPRAGLRVARFGGELIGGIRATSQSNLEAVAWVTASDWRYQLLRLNPFTKRDQCKIASLNLIPKLCPSINPHLEIHGHLDHITDALGVALWLKNK